jgi:hypothetical protein
VYAGKKDIGWQRCGCFSAQIEDQTFVGPTGTNLKIAIHAHKEEYISREQDWS